jgi:hypothetical protein
VLYIKKKSDFTMIIQLPRSSVRSKSGTPAALIFNIIIHKPSATYMVLYRVHIYATFYPWWAPQRITAFLARHPKYFVHLGC